MKRWLMLAAALALAPAAKAADHTDSPSVSKAPESDITDVYSWMSSDKSKVYLVMDVSPAATAASKFSSSVQYVFHLNSMDAYGESDVAKIKNVNIVCTFDSAQKVSCWLGPAATGGIGTPSDYVTGDASSDTGLTSMNGHMKVFTGLRNDPFFFNRDGFVETVKAVEAAAGQPGFASIVDASGCPHLDNATASALAAQLSHGKSGAAPTDAFAKMNVLSIVIAVDTSEAAPGGKILGVWASTHRKP